MYAPVRKIIREPSDVPSLKKFFFLNLLHSMKMLCKDRPCTLCCLILFIMGSMAVVRMCRSEEVRVGC